MKKRYSLAAVSLLMVLALASCAPPGLSMQSIVHMPTAAATAAPVRTQVQTTPALSSSLTGLDGTLEQIYSQVSPSVVSIQVTQQQAAGQTPAQPFTNPRQGQGASQALGSGFVWDQQGHIVTNNHVIDGADSIEVTFSDGTTVPGKVVGADPASDLAVVQVSAPAALLKPVTLGDSTQIKVGEVVAAIGNPFGLENTMTLGIVSAMGRSLPASAANNNGQGPTYTIPDVIQTDAPINPGNSGGVLVDGAGQVIGVPSAIISPVDTSAGIGFAIPAQSVQKIVPALIQTGHYAHVWLGITGTTLTSDLATASGLQSDMRGVLVVAVTDGSPAGLAGLRGSTSQATAQGQSVPVGGDVITAINGQAMKSFEDLVSYLDGTTAPGQKVTLSVWRDGKQIDVVVTLEARPSS